MVRRLDCPAKHPRLAKAALERSQSSDSRGKSHLDHLCLNGQATVSAFRLRGCKVDSVDGFMETLTCLSSQVMKVDFQPSSVCHFHRRPYLRATSDARVIEAQKPTASFHRLESVLSRVTLFRKGAFCPQVHDHCRPAESHRHSTIPSVGKNDHWIVTSKVAECVIEPAVAITVIL